MRIARLFLLLLISFYSIGLSAQKIKVTLASNLKEINEQCALLNNEIIRFKLDSVARTTRLYLIQFGGSATKGSDFATNTPDTLRFAIGDSVKNFDLTVFNDFIEEGQEEILVLAVGPAGTDTLSIKINDHVFKILTTQDSFSKCANEPFVLPVQSVTGASLSWSPGDMVKIGTKPGEYIISPTRSAKLILTGAVFNCVERDTITINSLPIGVTLNTRDTLYLCFPDSSRLIATVTPANASVLWSPLDSTTRVINNTSIR
jgi:hypothetical protein